MYERRTFKSLVKDYGGSTKRLRRQILSVKIEPTPIEPRPLVVIADCTFFSRRAGICVFYSPELKRVLAYEFIETETAGVYSALRRALEALGFSLLAVVLDGRRGLREVFRDIPIQMCQFHQLMIIRRYLTEHPRLTAGIELNQLCQDLFRAERSDFENRFHEWCWKWDSFLKEKTVIDNQHWFYTHRRLRAARRSIMTNLPYLFTYQEYRKLKIPNTSNELESLNSKLKELLYVHRGANKILKRLIISEILAK